MCPGRIWLASNARSFIEKYEPKHLNESMFSFILHQTSATIPSKLSKSAFHQNIIVTLREEILVEVLHSDELPHSKHDVRWRHRRQRNPITVCLQQLARKIRRLEIGTFETVSSLPHDVSTQTTITRRQFCTILLLLYPTSPKEALMFCEVIASPRGQARTHCLVE